MVLLAQDAIQSSSTIKVKMQTSTEVNKDNSVNHGCSKLYIGNLCMDVSEEDLRGFFVDLGVVPSSIAKMVVKKGFAFVEFSNQAAADMAMDLCDGKPLMNTLVRIEPSIRSEQINPKPRKLIQLLFTNCKH
jgi:RNA recognition motif-containing protein